MATLVDLPLVVVTWNKADCLEQWLGTVKQIQSPPGFRIRPIIVDNGSWDRTAAVIGEAIQAGDVARCDVHLLDANTGFVRAHNRVFRRLMARSEARFVALLNEDAKADPNWLCRLLDAATAAGNDDKIGMWGGPILTSQEVPDTTSSNGHRLRRSDAACLDIDWNRRTSASLTSNDTDFEPFAPCFAASLWSLAMFRHIGILDNEQFMYYDDVELAYRGRLAGWKAQWVPSATAFHPLPRRQPAGSRLAQAQLAGRLAMICRCLPDLERTRIVAELSRAEQDTLEELRLSGRDLKTRETNERRKLIWKQWAD